MTHRRSTDKAQLKQIRRIILASSFHDRVQSENVCRMTRTDVLGQLKGQVKVGLVPELVKGEVLIDSRGRGTLQH